MRTPTAPPYPETELLGALTIRRPQPVERQRELVGGGLDTDRLLGRARAEGVTGLLYANLKRADVLTFLPPRARDTLTAAYHRIAATNLCLQHALRGIGARLDRAGPEVIVLKGMALLDSLYEDPGTRATGDIDLRVAAVDRHALDGVLVAEGFASERFYPDTYRRGATTVDVHTHVLAATRIRSRVSILAGGEEMLLGHPDSTPYGCRLLRLTSAAELVLMSLHLMKHNADRLLWLIEINELVDRLAPGQWQGLVATFDAMDQRRTLSRVAFLADRLLPHTVSPRLRDAAAGMPPRRLERRALERRRARGALPVWAPLLFFAAPDWRRRATAAVETLLPRPAILRQVFEDADAGAWRLYLRRIGQLIGLVLRGTADEIAPSGSRFPGCYDRRAPRPNRSPGGQQHAMRDAQAVDRPRRRPDGDHRRRPATSR